MCGIAGVYSLSIPLPEDLTAELECASAQLNRRGPDGSGMIRHPVFAAAHTRLSIIDLEGGAQPMVDDQTGVTIAYNGEVYNYLELRRQLESLGHVFRTESDTEVILRAFIQYGIAMLEHLNGMFALALFDPRSRQLYLARDRFGEKPLYWARQGNFIFFASQLNAITRFSACSMTVTESGLLRYFALGYVAGPSSIFEGIQQVPHAHYVQFEPGAGPTEHCYYRRPAPRTRQSLTNDEIQEALDHTIALRLRADVPVATLLSGGLDSSVITAVAQQQLERPIQSYAFGWKGIPDERPYARAVADFVGTSHNEIELDRDLFMRNLDGVITAMDMPQADSASFVVYELSKRIRERGVKVVLSGEGGDELFGGYPWYPEGTGVRESMKRVLHDRPRRARDYVAGKHVFPDEVLTRAFSHRLVSAFCEERTGKFLACGTGPEARISFDYEESLPWGLLPKVDRMSMAHSVEVRAPFLDHELVGLWAALPPHDKVRRDQLKVRIREYCERQNIFPIGVLDRPKMGMNLPVSWWIRKHEDLFRDLLSSRGSTTTERFGRAEINRWFSDLAKHSTDGWSRPAQRIWSGTILDAWQHQHLSNNRSELSLIS